MILDATKKAEQRAQIEAELEAVGIRLNRDPPYDSLHDIFYHKYLIIMPGTFT